jgi:signal transduction histidine kinase
MLTMVSKLLDSEALESGELDVHKEPISMSKVAAEVVRRNRPQAERKQETLVFHLDEDDPYIVEGSAEWLREAMDNLVSNAIKYSPLGKTIWVVIERAGPFVRFIVRDEGPGLNEQDKEKLFGKFQRLSALPTSNESSTGLGLSIVKQIVELHGGRVWAESVEGQGSTFIIELDAVPAPDFGEYSGPLSHDRRDRTAPSSSRRAKPSSDNPFPAEHE